MLGTDYHPAVASLLSVVFPNLHYLRFPDPAPVGMTRLHKNPLAIQGQERNWGGNRDRFEREDTDPVASFHETWPEDPSDMPIWLTYLYHSDFAFLG